MTNERAGRRNWFITGVSGGIGRAIAAAALARGDRVVGTVRREADAAAFEALAPGSAFPLLLDVDQTEQAPVAAAAAIARLGRIDIVVNNAGRSLWGAVEETAIADARALFDTNVFGPMAVMQAFLPHFRGQGGGTVVNMSSGCGLFAVPAVGVYSASKFALEGLSEAVAAETAGFGVKIMLVEPGAVRTRFISHGTTETAHRMPEYAAVLGPGKAALDAYYETAASPPEDIADAILAALDRADPPFRLIVGADMRAAVEAKLAGLAAAAEG